MLTATARNKGSVENYCITLINLLSGSEFHFFNAFNRQDYASKNETSNNLFFIPNDRFHIQEDTTAEELSLFLTKNRIKIIHIHQCGYYSINLFRKAANLSNCIIITTCHSKPYALLLNYTYEYCIKKLKQVRLKGKLKILKRMLFLNANRNEAITEIGQMYHALFSSSDMVVLGSDYYVPELERILQREISYNEYQIINYCVPFKKYFPEQFLKRMKLSEIAVVGVFDETRFNLNRIIDVWNKIQVGPKYIGWVLRILVSWNLVLVLHRFICHSQIWLKLLIRFYWVLCKMDWYLLFPVLVKFIMKSLTTKMKDLFCLQIMIKMFWKRNCVR